MIRRNEVSSLLPQNLRAPNRPRKGWQTFNVGSTRKMERVEADRNNVHQHRPRQQRAGDATTEQKEGYSLNHHQDRTKDHAGAGP